MGLQLCLFVLGAIIYSLLLSYYLTLSFEHPSPINNPTLVVFTPVKRLLIVLTLTSHHTSLLLSHHHSTSALVSEILMSVLQTVQKNNNNNLHMDRQCKKTTNNLHMDRQCKKNCQTLCETSVSNDGRVNAHFGPEIKVLSTKMAHCSDKLFIIINLELKVSV